MVYVVSTVFSSLKYVVCVVTTVFSTLNWVVYVVLLCFHRIIDFVFLTLIFKDRPLWLSLRGTKIGEALEHKLP